MSTQTVFTVGNPITSRLRLGVVPDGTSVVSVVVRRPDGVAVTTTAVSDWGGIGGDEKTVQWFATDDGDAGSPVDAAAGDWTAVWTVTGTGATVAPKVYNVIPMPGTGVRPAWSPFLSEVADHIPFLTEDALTPGQVWLGTFTGRTSPTDEQAQRHVDSAVAYISARVGALASAHHPLARAAAAYRAAASILRAFARNSDDRDAARAMDERATAELTALIDAAEASGSAPATGPVPAGFFPPAPWWGDVNL